MSDQQPPQDPAQPNDGAGQQPAVPQPPPAAPVPPPAGGYAPAPGYGVPQTPQPQTNNNAIIALVIAIVSWAVCPIVAAIVALVFASKAGKEIEQSGGWQTGGGFVTAAKIIAWINIVVWPILIILYILFVVVLIGASSNIDDLYPTYTSGFNS